MEEHVILWIPGKITAVAADCHLFKRKPAVPWLTQMTCNRKSHAYYIFNDRIQSGIIGHYEFAGSVAQRHPYILPYFHCYCTI